MTITAANVNTAIEALLDRTACLVPNVKTYTANGSWAKPANALFIEITLVGGGGGGGGGLGDQYGPPHGGGGGASGSIWTVRFSAAQVPASLSVYVGAGGAGGAGADDTSADGTAGGLTYLSGTLNSRDWFLTAGGGNPGHGGSISSGAWGEASTTGRGWSARGGNGGAAGATGGTLNMGLEADFGGDYGTYGASAGSGGEGGGGYGGGGGGGGAVTCVGGGGGGGYGGAAVASNGANSTTAGANGGAGGGGFVMITSWCGVDLR